MAWVAFTFIADDVLTSAEMTNLFDDFQAFADQSSGAPILCNSYVNQHMLNAYISNTPNRYLTPGSLVLNQMFGQSQQTTPTMKLFSINYVSGNGTPILFSHTVFYSNIFYDGVFGDNLGAQNTYIDMRWRGITSG